MNILKSSKMNTLHLTKYIPEMKATKLVPKIQILLILSVTLPITGCDDTGIFEIDEDQKILFHYSYENYAWGYQFQGWFIDRDGIIWDLTESLHWQNEAMNIINGGNETYWTNRDILEDQYDMMRGRILGKIRIHEFESNIDLIEQIAGEQYSEPENTMADAGSVIYGFLSLDQGTNRYRKVILEGSGDWSYALVDTNAVVLSKWLNSIQDKIGYTDYDK
ncbi:MAG: hypothetical protein JSV24_08220 [Bacteroidales bacterium]|nr:MAG: hypothetical protein JSV24_08220 [Bacteroidales bacterium]